VAITVSQSDEGSLWSKLRALVAPALLAAGVLAGLALLFGGDEDKKRPRRRSGARAPSKPKPRAFISFAAEDAQARDLFVGQSRHPDTPWEIADFSLHEPFENAWKAKTKPRIKGCDVVILLIGKGTHQARGALWEIEIARELAVPVFGVHISKDDKGKLPGCMFGIPVIHWTWEGIAKQITKATRMSQRR
jgi:antiphage defense system Thoeris ThsB-like protein